ncbi:TIGR04219 family outer membrane beta-barrel protein [Pseudidiomarina sp.]|uniref:TIGR04219 family outer membrane beta-barrel protein n=1 Tax=Pseudidiomarina sp. TaxID=2081707 RepID=UPI003A96F79E
MRKVTLTLALVVSASGLIAAPQVNADTVFGVYAGAQTWKADTSGSFGSEQSTSNFSFADDQQGSAYIAFEHPIPLFPNVKVRHNDLVTDGNQLLNEDFSFFGTNFAANSRVNYTADLSHTDYTLYYELFDNDLVSFDLGVTAKRVDGSIEVRGEQTLQGQSTDGWIPTLYSQLRVGIPATDLTLYGLANAVSIEDSKVEDYEFGVEYRPIENLAVDVNLQLGYRVFNVELDDLDGIYSNLEYKGPYLGVEFHF